MPSRCLTTDNFDSHPLDQYIGYTCRAEGCRASNGRGGVKRGHGRGYCAKHFRQFLRSGDPLTRLERARNMLLDAAFRYEDDPREPQQINLCACAFRLGSAARRGTELPQPANGELLARGRPDELRLSARSYVGVPTGKDWDATFVKASLRLEDEAKRYTDIFYPRFHKMAKRKP